MKRTLVFIFLAACAQPAPRRAGFAQRPAATPDLSISYAVDPAWPHRPAEFAPGAVAGVAVDLLDRVWTFTRGTPPVQVFDTQGQFVSSWRAEFVKAAHFLRIDPDGHVWLADAPGQAVYKCTADGDVLLTLGTPGKPGCDESHFDHPTDMAVTPAGDVFISDGYRNNRIVHFDREGKFVKAWGKFGAGPGEFSLPHSIVLDSKGHLYVADRNNARIQVFEQSGAFVAEWRNLLVPWGLWISPQDELWACGSSPMTWRPEDRALGVPPKDQLFMKLSLDGRLLQLWTVPRGQAAGELDWVHSIALDQNGNIYAGDIEGRRVQKFIRK